MLQKTCCNYRKNECPEAVRKEIEVAFLVSKFEKHKIPPSLDQTPAKVVPGSKSTQVLKGATDKRAITATLSKVLKVISSYTIDVWRKKFEKYPTC